MASVFMSRNIASAACALLPIGNPQDPPTNKAVAQPSAKTRMSPPPLLAG